MSWSWRVMLYRRENSQLPADSVVLFSARLAQPGPRLMALVATNWLIAAKLP